MDIQAATADYESWLRRFTPLVGPDLKFKHRQMRLALFPFLRATFYRWTQRWEEICPDLNQTPKVPGVGDLHVENFGTWRDAEGRLVWGVNDFDEAFQVPYANDLVRLASSALLSIEGGHLKTRPAAACEAILKGYADAIEAGGRPIVVDEKRRWLIPLLRHESRDPVLFWKNMRALPPLRGGLPASAWAAIESLMPERGLAFRIARRVAGMGSLGKPRFVALIDWHGGPIAREAKALTPSAYLWLRGAGGAGKETVAQILAHAVRCPDPLFRAQGRWIARRLAPDCSRIELESLASVVKEIRLLRAMGWETANIHLASPAAAAAAGKDLRRRPGKWLRTAAQKMIDAVVEDWKQWKKLKD